MMPVKQNNWIVFRGQKQIWEPQNVDLSPSLLRRRVCLALGSWAQLGWLRPWGEMQVRGSWEYLPQGGLGAATGEKKATHQGDWETGPREQRGSEELVWVELFIVFKGRKWCGVVRRERGIKKDVSVWLCYVYKSSLRCSFKKGDCKLGSRHLETDLPFFWILRSRNHEFICITSTVAVTRIGHLPCAPGTMLEGPWATSLILTATLQNRWDYSLLREVSSTKVKQQGQWQAEPGFEPRSIRF